MTPEELKQQAHKEFDERYQISDETYSFDTALEIIGNIYENSDLIK